MPIQYVLVEDIELLDALQQLFGDVLVAAHWCLSEYKVEKGKIPNAAEGFDSEDVVLTFANGKRVMIWNSEWGGFEEWTD